MGVASDLRRQCIRIRQDPTKLALVLVVCLYMGYTLSGGGGAGAPAVAGGAGDADTDAARARPVARRSAAAAPAMSAPAHAQDAAAPAAPAAVAVAVEEERQEDDAAALQQRRDEQKLALLKKRAEQLEKDMAARRAAETGGAVANAADAVANGREVDDDDDKEPPEEATKPPPPPAPPSRVPAGEYPAEIALSNDMMSLRMKVKGAVGRAGQILEYFDCQNKHRAVMQGNGNPVHMIVQPEIFLLKSEKHGLINASDCTLTDLTVPGTKYPRFVSAALQCTSVKLAFSATLASGKSQMQIKVKWTYTLNIDKLTPRYVVMASTDGRHVQHAGSAMGTPYVDSRYLLWLALESPLSVNGILQNDRAHAVCATMYLSSLSPGGSEELSMVIGAEEDHTQLRRSFNAYISATRAHAGRTRREPFNSTPMGGQSDFVCLPARTPHGGASYVW